MAIALNDLYEVRLITYSENQVGINVLHYVCDFVSGDPALLTELDVAEAVSLEVSTQYKALMADTAEFVGVGARRLLPVLGAETIWRSHAGFGTVLGGIMPRQVSGVITKHTAFGGRRRRGRLYVTFPGAMDSTALARPSAGYITRLQALGDRIDQAVTITEASPAAIATLIPVLRSSLAVPATALITSCTARIKWGTQRRRGGYGRVNDRP